MPQADFVVHVGDRRQLWRWTVYEWDAVTKGWVLATLTTPTVLMVPRGSQTPKINYVNATIAGVGQATYQPTAGDVDTAGFYYLWLRDVSATRAQHWPTNGRTRLVEIRAVIPPA